MSDHHYGRPMQMPMGTSCQVHRHREWVPLERHHVWPLGLGGPNRADNLITVCANAHYSIHAYLDHLMKYGEKVPLGVMAHFGYKVRRYALKGWFLAGKPTHGKAGE